MIKKTQVGIIPANWRREYKDFYDCEENKIDLPCVYVSDFDPNHDQILKKT